MRTLPDFTHSVRIDVFKYSSFKIFVLRLDLIHPVTGGNKWFKLEKNIAHFRQGSFKGIMSFGGAYSNHIAALADAGNRLGIPTLGMIRGEEAARENVTLSRARTAGMKLHFVSREEYRQYRSVDAAEKLMEQFGNWYVIPEGGSNAAGVEGCIAIADLIPASVTDVLLPVGTGATFAGVALGLHGRCNLLGVKVLEAKQEDFIFDFPGLDLLEKSKISLTNQFTFGGYAKKSNELDIFVNQWNEENEILIEPVYSGRLFFAVRALIDKGFFDEEAEIMLLHTGGRQYLEH